MGGGGGEKKKEEKEEYQSILLGHSRRVKVNLHKPSLSNRHQSVFFLSVERPGPSRREEEGQIKRQYKVGWTGLSKGKTLSLD